MRPRRPREYFRYRGPKDLPPPVRGALSMVLAVVFWSAMLVFVRGLSDQFSTFQILFMRNLVALAIMVPWFARTGFRRLRTRRLRLHCLRTLLAYLGMLGLFYGVSRIAMADVVALSFTQPLFIVVMAALLLGESVGARRWLAAAAGFCGVLIIVRPGFAEVGPATLVVLAAAASYAGSNICIKLLMASETPTHAVFYVNVLMLPLALAPALLTWSDPGWGDAAAFVGIGVAGSLGVYFVSGAYAAADASAVQPYDFLRLPVTAAAAWLLFSESADVWTWIGAVVIFASSYALVRLEARGASPPAASSRP